MRAFELRLDDLQLRRLQRVDPLLPSLANVLYEYTIPQLSSRVLQALSRQSVDSGRLYTGHRDRNDGVLSRETSCLQALEAAQRISGIYSHFLGPLRFGSGIAQQPTRDEIFNGFVRALVGVKVLPAAEYVAAHIQILRSLDEYQDGIGTNAVRWMQYLAYEALQTNVVRRGFTTGRELDRLGCALLTLRESSSVLDRFQALGRASARIET